MELHLACHLYWSGASPAMAMQADAGDTIHDTCTGEGTVLCSSLLAVLALGAFFLSNLHVPLLFFCLATN